jgi:hypothetical protein
LGLESVTNNDENSEKPRPPKSNTSLHYVEVKRFVVAVAITVSRCTYRMYSHNIPDVQYKRVGLHTGVRSELISRSDELGHLLAVTGYLVVANCLAASSAAAT